MSKRREPESGHACKACPANDDSGKPGAERQCQRAGKHAPPQARASVTGHEDRVLLLAREVLVNPSERRSQRTSGRRSERG
ncbi:MAG: hypothetical protein NVS2B6_09520 [Thermoleophilaceae bacterium]